jgi:hypothetical protein
LYRFALVDRFGERSLIDEAHDDRAAGDGARHAGTKMQRRAALERGIDSVGVGDDSLCATTLNLIEVKIRSRNVRFGSKADIEAPPTDVRLFPRKRTFADAWPCSITCRHTGWKSAVNFAKYDVERAEYRRDISEHVSASQEIHCPQVWE